jgi:hypothetical protein
MFNPIGKKLIYGWTYIWPQPIVLKVAILVEIHNIDFQPNKPRNNFKNSQLFICIYIHGAICGKHMKKIYII